MYTVRQPELGGQPGTPRQALLVIEVQCLQNESNKPWSVATAFVTHMNHIYGSRSEEQVLTLSYPVGMLLTITVQIHHCIISFTGFTLNSAKQHLDVQAKAMKFLEDFAPGQVNVLITLDAHATTGNGHVAYGKMAAPLLPVSIIWFVYVPS